MIVLPSCSVKPLSEGQKQLIRLLAEVCVVELLSDVTPTQLEEQQSKERSQ
jgi:hypothetical protein